MREFLDTHGEWVIDGNYSRYEYARRMEEADRILFMDFPRVRCFFRAWKRAKRFRGKTRESITAGCDEKFDREFRRWILKDGRSAKIKARYRGVTEKYPDKVFRARNDREAQKFIELLEKRSDPG